MEDTKNKTDPFSNFVIERKPIQEPVAPVVATNIKKLKDKFFINQQIADNLGHKEMTTGVLAGLHQFVKKAGIYFADINAKDECIIAGKKYKVYIRTAEMDNDILVYDEYFTAHPEIDFYLCCKVKGGKYEYVGYVTKATVEQTRVVSMIGQDNSQGSKPIRRIFAEQYLNLNTIIRLEDEEQKEEKKDEDQKYVPLHLHSEFSVGDAYGGVKYIAEKLYKKGFKGAALTDHGTLAGVFDFQKALLEKGLKPIIGCEAYMQIPNVEQRYHITLLVKSKKGWENLLLLQHKAVTEDFYYKPIVKYENLIAHGEGLIVLSGCMTGIFYNLIKANHKEEAIKYATQLKEVFKDDFYAEFMLHNIQDYQAIMQEWHKIAKDLELPMVLTTDTHYSEKEDVKYHETIKAIGMKKKFGEAGYHDDCFYLLQEKDIAHLVDRSAKWISPYIEEMKANTLKILDKIEFKIEPIDEIDTLPKMLPTKEERQSKLKQDVLEGLAKHTPYLYEGVAKERVDLELDRILSKGYENYFLIVADMVNWAKTNGILVGPGRGSVGASLASYALGITECDPIKFELLFDRFLSIIRKDLPDVDLDFQDDRRDEIYQYLENKYGKDNCKRIITYSRFHAKGALRDMGRIFSIPLPEVERVCKLVIERSGGDARAGFSLIDTFEEFEEAKKFKQLYPDAVDCAIHLEGHVRHKGVGAAGFLISEKPVYNYVPITKVGDAYVTEWEKNACEEMHLVKFDILALKTLSVIKDCMNALDIELPRTFEDKKVYETIFKTGNTLGVFQFETVGLSKLVKNLQCDDFRTLYDATTLYRPGALHSGQTMMYVARKQGKEQIAYEHPLLEQITKKTKGIILYQEQVMLVMHKIGNMSWATAEMVRKNMTKSKGAKSFQDSRKEFIENAHKFNHMPKEDAEKLFDVVSTFGSYSFNEAHAVEYSIISYWCAWLKTYHPQAFFKAMLKFEADDATIYQYLQNMEKEGIAFEYPEINLSDIEYKIFEKKIYAGFSTIKGIGNATAKKIINNRPYTTYEEFLQKTKVSGKILKGLIIADAFRNFKINRKICFNATKATKNYYDNITQDFTEIETAQNILELTTLKPRLNILKTYDFGDYNFTDIGTLSEANANKEVLVRGIITATFNKDRLINSQMKGFQFKYEPKLLYINVNDGTGDCAVTAGPHTYELYAKFLEKPEGTPVIVLGTASGDGKKISGDIIQFGKLNEDIKNYFHGDKDLIASAIPAVSKKGKSYYRVRMKDGRSGMCFRFTEKIKPLMKAKAIINQPPFMDIYIQR